MSEYTPVALLTAQHNRSEFDCGIDALNIYLQKYALQNQKKHMVRNYVTYKMLAVKHKSDDIVGYYSLAYGSTSQIDSPTQLTRGIGKYPIPVMILARLAVDEGEKRKGLGKALLKNAMLRTLQASDIAGLKAIFVQAKNDDAREFYEKYGFIPAHNNPFFLFFPLDALRA